MSDQTVAPEALAGRAPDRALKQALAAYKAGDREAAGELCERILAGDPNNVSARHLLGGICLELGQLDAGIAHLELLLSLQPGFPGAQALLAKALARAGCEAEAIAALRIAVSDEPQDLNHRVALAGLLAKTDEIPAAIALLQPVLKSAPENLSLLNNLGGLYARNGQGEDALALFERAVQIEDRAAISHYNLAKALKEAGELTRAVGHYQRALELDPALVTGWRNLGNLYLDLGEIEAGAQAYERGTQLKWSPDAKSAPDASQQRTSRSKLQHDIEQMDYLLAHKRIDPQFQKVLAGYREVLGGMPETSEEGEKSLILEVKPKHRKHLTPYFNRLIYRPPAPALEGPAVNPDFDVAAVEADYLKNAPGMTFADNFLTEPALQSLRRFCLESTVWYRHSFAKGYVGAFMEDGFLCPLLLQIAEELRSAFPAIFGDHSLRKLWAFKYDSRLSGIPIHADFAAINVNFWITPDAANRNPETGGLVVWDKKAPRDWDFKKYNADETAIRGFLAESDAKSYAIPHRENRMVMFNSDLFHETGALDFHEGYENRRINITMLYGKRENAK